MSEQEERVSVLMALVSAILLLSASRLCLFVLEYTRGGDPLLMVGGIMLIVKGIGMSTHMGVLIDFIAQHLPHNNGTIKEGKA